MLGGASAENTSVKLQAAVNAGVIESISVKGGIFEDTKPMSARSA